MGGSIVLGVRSPDLHCRHSECETGQCWPLRPPQRGLGGPFERTRAGPSPPKPPPRKRHDKPQIQARYYNMPETMRRRLSIARELMTWAEALPRLLARIDKVLKLPDITKAQTADIESIAELVGTVFLGIREAVDSDDYDRMIASVDRLREEIARANEILDRLLKPNS